MGVGLLGIVLDRVSVSSFLQINGQKAVVDRLVILARIVLGIFDFFRVCDILTFNLGGGGVRSFDTM